MDLDPKNWSITVNRSGIFILSLTLVLPFLEHKRLFVMLLLNSLLVIIKLKEDTKTKGWV